MARQLHMLSALDADPKKKKKRGFYCDGGGLYLQVSKSGSKSWVFRFKQDGRTRDMGLGSAITVSLADARDAALEQRKLRLKHIDPIEHRDDERKRRKIEQELEKARTMTFDQCFEGFYRDKSPTWSNAKHRQQWKNTIAEHASPVFGSLPVREIDTPLVLKAIEPIWHKMPETANRLRNRIEKVLDWAKARHYRDGENPATWKGNIEHILAAPDDIKEDEHYPALPWEQAGEFMADLRTRGGVAARALEFAILCAVRTGDIIGGNREDKPPLLWDHIDWHARTWTIPSTKNDSEHVVPLSDAAVSLLKKMQTEKISDAIVFPGQKANKPLSNMSMTKVIRTMNSDREKNGLGRYIDPKQNNRDVVPHGFRSTFNDWAYECSNFPSEIADAALAHKAGTKTEQAYKRGAALAKRRKLMDAWASFCATAKGNVTHLRAAR